MMTTPQVSTTFRRPWMYAKQEAAIWAPERYSVIEAGTKTGKTVGCMAWMIEQALQGHATHYWWIAPSRKQAKIAFERTARGLPAAMIRVNNSAQTIQFPNRHVIHYLTGEKPDLLYGDDVGAAVLDEFTRLREEAWFAVRSTLTATRGPVRFIGNVRGKRNWGYLLARRAQANPKWHYARITWKDAVEAGVLDADEIEAARNDLPPHVFQELYEAEASDDDTNPFGMDRVRECVKPPSRRETAAWGWDLAKSVDYTCGCGMDRRMQWTQFEHWQRPWKETGADIIRLIRDVPTLIDSTGVGDPVVELIQRRARENNARVFGFKFTMTSRQQLLEGLRMAIHEKACSIPEDAVSEFDSFEYVYNRMGGVKYVAPEGMHDDKVMGVALAVQCIRTIVRDPITIRFGDEPAEGLEKEVETAQNVAEGMKEIEDTIMVDGAWGFDDD